MKTGTVKFFNEQKGYGFIEQPGTAEDVFLHQSNVRGGALLSEGQSVTFDIGEGRRGPEAVNVELSALAE